MPKIDVHTHFLPEPYIETLVRHDINWTGGVDLDPWTPAAHLRFMDDWGIDVGVLSCLAETGVYFGDQREADELARNVNDIGADVVRQYPRRFGVFGAVPLPGVDSALAELDHIYDDLGLDGVYLVSQVDGTYVGDPKWEAVYDALDKRGATVLLHPVEPKQTPDLPWQHWIGEYVFDTTRVFMTLVFHGVLDRYPHINWILSHGGGTVPYLGHRFAAAPRVVQAYRELVRRPIPEYLRSVYYDVAVADSQVQINTLVDAVGTDRMLFGTDWIYADKLFDHTRTGEHDLTRLLGADAARRVGSDNALRILPRLAERLAAAPR
ncbi:putative TIM-barrel fold metal-dependent hydrolase [Streptomyces sp. B3I7]|uniref:amidohydrolase family protein n=1 Tax=Streptomyces sp. B3I7 TaxID=3042269 RepID=UPI00278AC399|nr:amidohydrolase family protein [Streptomyces sp. B3I7]MDQ0812834.1 putative TIM-barrel fold metal-dependent hydrolase [Streptomyces sp. B3I7]